PARRILGSPTCEKISASFLAFFYSACDRMPECSERVPHEILVGNHRRVRDHIGLRGSRFRRANYSNPARGRSGRNVWFLPGALLQRVELLDVAKARAERRGTDKDRRLCRSNARLPCLHEFSARQSSRGLARLPSIP